ncbi:RNA polymerase sigma factor [Phenylobacterium sp.]|uniref:RNA polymerase sigma factor n=1 Tax=Phenylobacterium sp. TaxID=1871053 RepID=UPI0035AEC9BC
MAAAIGYREALKAYFRRRVDGHEIDDLVQDVLFRIHNRRATEAVRNPSSFIFQTAANVLQDRRRRDAARRTRAHGPLDDAFHPPDELSPDRVYQAKQDVSVALAALNELQPRTRAALMLVRFEGLSYKAAASALGISVSAVEKHVVKALQVISSRLQDVDE